jgi:hypothetical protein
LQQPSQAEAPNVKSPLQCRNNAGKFVKVGALGQVVIRPSRQPRKSVGHTGTCSQHNDAEAQLLLTQLLHQIKSGAVWQANVDDGNAMLFGAETLREPGQTARGLHCMTISCQKLNQLLAQDLFVFNQDDVRHDG